MPVRRIEYIRGCSSTRKRVKLNGSLAQQEFKDLNKKTKDAQEKIRRIKSESKQLEARMDLANWLQIIFFAYWSVLPPAKTAIKKSEYKKLTAFL